MRFSNKNDNEDSCVIMSETDIVNGVGAMKEMVDLEMFYQESVYYQNEKDKSKYHFEIVHYWKGCCDICGYDRGIHVTHTEVETAQVKCDNCDAVVFNQENA